MHSKLSTPLAVALLIAALSGCSKNAKFTYPLDPPIQSLYREPSSVKIAVLPARDLRGATNADAGIGIAFLPLVPYGWMTYERPEAATGFISIGSFDCDMAEDIPKAIAQHWREAGVSRNTFFDQGMGADQAHYTLHVTLNKTTYEGRLVTYCVSIFSAYLWILGAPTSSFEITLDIGLELRDRRDQIVWRANLRDQQFNWAGAYYNEGGDMEGLALTLQRTLDATASSAAETIRKLEARKRERAAERAEAKRQAEKSKPRLHEGFYR